MIDRREIIDIASVQSLSPQVVEKDYVLGSILAAWWLTWRPPVRRVP